MDPDPATQFNADPDLQPGGEVIIQHMKNWKSRKKQFCGSGIRCLFDPMDPDLGSGIGFFGSRISDLKPIFLIS
jgi:hypothetical protein